MAPAPDAAAVLFHPRNKKKTQPPGNRPLPSKPVKKVRIISKPTPKPEESETGFSFPEGPYTEYKLVSSALNGWKYDVMKFESRKPVDIMRWTTPVKLNRKDVRRPETTAIGDGPAPKAVGVMLGPDGKQVVGMDGRTVMIDAEGKPIHNDSANGKGKAAAPAARRKFQKKTKQVFMVPEHIRQLRKEERYPWVMEDASGSEVWVGKMEEVVKAETHGLFMPASNNTFKFVPAHRWYKFQKRPNYHIPNLEEAESLMALWQKNKDPERWLLHKRGGKGPSDETSAMLKAESSSNGLSASGSGRSLGPGGRRLRTVVGSQDLFGDDEEGSQGRRRDGADADYDEVPYQEDFADDEEKVNPEEEEDEEAKELEERIQRAYMQANKQRDGHIDESDDEDDGQELTGAGKAMKKLVRQHEKNDAYDSDEEGNPYASEEEEEMEEENVVTNEPAVQPQPQARAPSQPPRSGSQAPAQPPAPATPRPAGPSSPTSRANSPVPSHGGHSIVAKRATSPKMPKPKAISTNGSRASSPLAQNAPSPSALGDASRAPSPPATSSRPIASTSGGATAAPRPNKRKADEQPDSAGSPTAPSGSGPPKAKKRKAAVPKLGPDGKPVPLEDHMVIDWLRNTPDANTRDCIAYFTPYLHNDEEKTKFTTLIKTVAALKGGVLTLRNAYRDVGGELPTPKASDSQAFSRPTGPR